MSDDTARWEMEDENVKMTQVMDELAQWSANQNVPQKWKLPPCGQPISAFGSDSQKDLKMRPQDDSELTHKQMELSSEIFVSRSHIQGVLRGPHVLHVALPSQHHS